MKPTDRQMEALALLAEGHSREEITRLMGYSTKNRYNSHPIIQRLFDSLGATNAPHAVHIAHQEGWLTA